MEIFCQKRLWPRLATGLALGAALIYLFFILSNWIYLGFSDTLYFFSHPRMWSRFWLTVETATAATLMSMGVGIPTGYALSRFNFPCQNLLSALIDLPVVVSPAIVGAFLFGISTRFPFDWLAESHGIYLGRNLGGVIWVQFTVTAAFCARLMKSAFDAVPPRYEAVSRSLGAGPFTSFFKVALPMAKNGILASIIVVWARAAAEWEGLMLFVGATEGKTDIMPFAVYLDWNGGMMGWVTSMTLVCILMAVTAMAAVRIIGGKSHVW